METILQGGMQRAQGVPAAVKLVLWEVSVVYILASYFDRGVVPLFIFLEKTKQKIVMTLESLRLQGRSP
jgi:hypothetical protein